MQEQWFIKAIKGDFDGIARHFNISPITARLLVNRHLSKIEDIDDFIYADKRKLSYPGLMKDIDKGCRIISTKINEGKKIRIIGDYDVDGVCSTYILYDGLKYAGAFVSYDIPDRIKDGYGINERLIDKAHEDGVDTILTCDNGIAALEQVEHAKKLGMTVVITDHHDIPIAKVLPPADAVTDPKQADCEYPYKGLCGAGIAYQLIRHFYLNVIKKGDEEEIKKKYLAFAALATVCDVMELTGENRTLVKDGLSYIKNSENIGLRELLAACGLIDEESGTVRDISVYHCGFVIGPSINACGRLGSALKAMELFTCEDRGKGWSLAEELRNLNDERKSLTEEGMKKADEIAGSKDYLSDKVLIIYIPDCHESIVGIVAGKIKEKYHKPTVVLTNAESGIKGSGRSIEEYNMFEELSKCSELFAKFGGHPMAAGLSIKGDSEEEQLRNLAALRERLNKNTKLTDKDLMPKIHFDMVLPFAYATVEQIHEFDILEPFGTGNDSPLFARKDVVVKSMRVLGKNRNAVKMQATDGDSGSLFTVMYFGNADYFIEELSQSKGRDVVEKMAAANGYMCGDDFKMDIVYSPGINEYNGNVTVQMIIKNFR